MRYREIEPKDVKEIIILRTMVKENALSMDELISMNITESEVIKKIKNEYKGWLCEDDKGKILGFSMGNKTTAEMWVIAVLPEYEKRGIGGKLMQLVQDWLFQYNDELWLTTENNHDNRAYGFYGKLGWKESEIIGEISKFTLSKNE